MTPFRLMLMLGLLLLSGCGSREVARETTRLLMGTLVTIKTWNVPDEVEKKAVEKAFAEMERLEAMMSAHRADTPVYRINHAPRGEWHPAPYEVAALLTRANLVKERSHGAFDPGLEPLTRLWGFSNDPPAQKPPPAAALAEWRKQRVRKSDVLVRSFMRGSEVQLSGAGVGIDLGGIAKGYAVDRAVETLFAHGVKNAIVNAGGNLRVVGSKGEQPWRVGVQHPRDPERAIVAMDIRGDLAVVTSGDYERFFIHDGVRYHHLLDPTRGEPARTGIISVTIQATTAEEADALSTAVFVLGVEKGLALLKDYPGVEALLIGPRGEHQQTAGFKGEWQEEAWPEEMNQAR